MTDALEGPRVKQTTLREQANSPRIGRARFIGNGVGFIILFAAASAAIGAIRTALSGGGIAVALPFSFKANFTGLPPSAHLEMIGHDALADSILLVIGTLLWMDLVVRRRRDRGKSGLDGVVWQLLFLASQFLYELGILPVLVPWLDLVVDIGALYLLVVLVFLPGTAGDNRYGPDPRIS